MTLKNGLNIKVTNLDTITIMESALNGGISYWCNRISPVGKLKGKSITEHLVNGGSLILHDGKCDTDEELTLDKFQSGLSQFLSKVSMSLVMDKEGNYTINTDFINADDADAIIQFALYGCTVFGNHDFF